MATSLSEQRCNVPGHPPLPPLPQQPRHELPMALRGIAPSIGTQWVWEPYKDHARELVTVTAVTWNGEECWVETVNTKGQRYVNPLGRWVEATVFWKNAEGED